MIVGEEHGDGLYRGQQTADEMAEVTEHCKQRLVHGEYCLLAGEGSLLQSWYAIEWIGTSAVCVTVLNLKWDVKPSRSHSVYQAESCENDCIQPTRFTYNCFIVCVSHKHNFKQAAASLTSSNGKAHTHATHDSAHTCVLDWLQASV